MAVNVLIAKQDVEQCCYISYKNEFTFEIECYCWQTCSNCINGQNLVLRNVYIIFIILMLLPVSCNSLYIFQ